MVSAEDILIKEQIKYILKEVYKIKDMYFSDNSEDDVDYYRIICDYEVKADKEGLTREQRLVIYKEMYQKCLDFLYDSTRRYTEENSENEEIEYIEPEDIEEEDIEEEGRVPF